MSKHVAVQCLAALTLASGPTARAAERSLAGPPVDYSIYREGTVQRVERRFDSWLMTCDQIASLSRKFCSLRGLARAGDGTIIASVVVSTNDAGRPTALVTLPVGTLFRSGAITMRDTGRKPPSQLDLRPTTCDENGCGVVWSLTADDIGILSRGAPLKMNFTMVDRSRPFDRFDPAPQRAAIAGTLATVGFADALRASLN